MTLRTLFPILLLATAAHAQVSTVQGGPADVASFEINRQALYDGGTVGWVNSAIRADTTVGPNVLAYEWSILGRIESASTTSQAVGIYGQATATAPNVTVWGGVSEARDGTGPNGTPGASAIVVGHEVDTVGGKRSVGIDVVAVSPPDDSTGISIESKRGDPRHLRRHIQLEAAQPCDMTSPTRVTSWDEETADGMDGRGRCTLTGATFEIRKLQGQVIEWCSAAAGCHGCANGVCS